MEFLGVSLTPVGGVFMNVVIEKDAANFIRKHSKDNSVTLFIKAASGG